MRKFHKRFTIDQQDYENSKKLPFVNQSEFSAKLNDLLEKVSVQNRYASRISQCNMKNLLQLEQAKGELKKIAQEKKMDQLKANDTKDLIEQMSIRVKDSESELERLFKEVVAAKKEIKHLKSLIADLQNENLLLERQLLQAKRQKFQEVCSARQEVDTELLSTHIGNFLLSSMHIDSFLYKFCLQAHRSNSLANFFNDLNAKIEKEIRRNGKSGKSFSLENRINTNLKLRPARNQSVEGRERKEGLRRYETQHHQVKEFKRMNYACDSLQ